MNTQLAEAANLVEAHGLVKRYGARTVVDGVDLVVSPGEVVGVIGPNGAGKSTTLEIILGLRAADAGKVTYWRADFRREVGAQLQSTPFFRSLTTLENLEIFAAFYGLRVKRDEAMALLATCGLTEVARTEAAKLSGGQKKRLAIALTLVHSPRLIFLDEPTAALDPRARHEIRELIRALAARGVAIVFTSHDMEEVSKLADRVALIVGGRVRAQGTPTALLEQWRVKDLEELYLRLTAQTTEEDA
jgi:ABC-2 type transport system ATP-binding protein